jgi:glutamate dehydrogenase
LLRYLTYRVIANRKGGLDIERAVSALRPGLKELLQRLPSLLVGLEAAQYEASLGKFKADGAPDAIARRVASFGAGQAAIDAVDIAVAGKLPVERAAKVYFRLGASLGLDWIRSQIEGLTVEGHWQAVARGTLREEAYSLQRAISTDVLKVGGAREPDGAIEAWIASRGHEVDTLRRMVQEMRSVDGTDFATLSVALQAVRRLAAR